VETTRCPFCREEIKAGAIKCKHCSSMIVDVSQVQNRPEPKKEGTLWLPLPSMIIGILCFITLLDDSEWDIDTFAGFFTMATTSFILGVISVNTQKTGKGMAITGIVLSSISLLAGIGLAID
jgi:hypothetical protein